MHICQINSESGGLREAVFYSAEGVIYNIIGLLCGFFRSGCSTSEDMLWKLDALQSFIRELHWPEEVFAEHLDHRLKLMAADMIEAAAKR